MILPPGPPALAEHEHNDVRFWSDDELVSSLGVLVAFTGRTGGVSEPPYASLNLAAHVGDDAVAVDENRDRALEALGISSLRHRLTTAEQVHGADIAAIDDSTAGSGAFVGHGTPPIARCDAMLTSAQGVPLMMLYADCVPVVLVGPGPVIGVVHAGWRGALERLPGTAAAELSRFAQCDTSDLIAYVGPHVGGCCYEIGENCLSQFVNVFGTFARAESGALDLGAVVQQDLTDAGVSTCRITSLGRCTAEETDQFYSYRTEGGLTGRHGAIACILHSSS